MDVYDFDGTLYRGDSTLDFVAFCARRHAGVALTLPRAGIAAAACMGFNAIDKTRFKAELYRFLTRVPDIDRELYLFWAAHEGKIAGPCQPREDDLVISASPEFLLRDVCKRRGLKLIASQVDPHTGRVLGPNCSGGEKVVRLFQRYPKAHVERFFSDSRNDDPMARIAKQPFMVNIRRATVSTWPQDLER